MSINIISKICLTLIILEIVLQIIGYSIIGHNSIFYLSLFYILVSIIRIWINRESNTFSKSLFTFLMFIPIYLIYLVFSLKSEMILHEDNHYRLQENILSINEPLALPYLYKKEGLIEKRITIDYPKHLTTFFDTNRSDINDVKITDNQDSLIVEMNFKGDKTRYLVKKKN